MDFFEQQEQARRASRRLVPWYLLAIVFVVFSFNVVVALIYAVLALYGAVPLAGGEAIVWHGLMRTYGHALTHVPASVHLAVSGVVAAVVLAVTARRMWRLWEGGPAVADMLGAHYLERSRVTPAEARLLNVVDEMAIASGISVPPIYLLADEDAINALVAGHRPDEAVIIATRGLVRNLTRDELQGVMGHEFSHILNGDMALNLRLVSLLAGVACFGVWGEAMVYGGAAVARKHVREERGGEAVQALFGAAIAFIGFPGSLAARAIRAAISRQREFLADAASVQFTRNPDGIAGALDTVRYLGAGTVLRSTYAGELSHMFFMTAIVRGWGFPTHPPIAERIYRANPRFHRDDYRRTRPGSHSDDGQVAVLDGLGNVVEKLGGLGAAVAIAAAPKPEHVDYARRLLGHLPPALKTQLARPEGAAQVMLTLLGAPGELPGIGRRQFLLLVQLAVPALREWPQPRRDAFLAEARHVVEADGRVTLTEFVLLTLLRQRLREGAGKPIPTRFQRVEEVAADAHAVISLIAHASMHDTEAAYARGRAVLGLPLPGPMPAELAAKRVGEALERLHYLQPFEKPRVLKACVETAAADGVFRVAEVELVRAVAATLDCPIPPVIGALDPDTLAA